MSDPDARWIPLFPLETVLFPGGMLPLHVFEPRYRALVERCRAESLPFGIVLSRKGDFARVGCAAGIERVLRTYEDGRLDLLARGEERVRVLESRRHGAGYLEGRVAPLTDEAEETDPEGRRVLEALATEYRRSEGREGAAAAPVPPEEDITFDLARETGMELEESQSFLEIRSRRAREEVLARRLAAMIPEVRAAVERRRRVGGNGDLRG